VYTAAEANPSVHASVAPTLDASSHVLPSAGQETAEKIAALTRALVEEVAQAL
jgi:hypothetical protein